MQKFCKGGCKLGVFKKEGAHLQAASGGALEDNVKNEFGNIKGGKIDTRGGGGGHPLKYTPVCVCVKPNNRKYHLWLFQYEQEVQ